MGLHVVTNVCMSWEGLDYEVEDLSACVKCGEIYERHEEKQAYVMSVVDHPESTLTIIHYAESD